MLLRLELGGRAAGREGGRQRERARARDERERGERECLLPAADSSIDMFKNDVGHKFMK
jgi:hypothetical protein